MIRVGLIGFGAVGSGLAEAIHSGKAGTTRLVAVLEADPARVPATAVAKYGFSATSNLRDFLGNDMQIVVEGAGAQALRQYAEPILSAGKDLMPLSVSAFADSEFFGCVRQLAKERGCRVLIPSGAIAALDGISAAALCDIEEVVHTIRKNPRSFSPTQLKGLQPAGATLLYDGPARVGVQQFPENANVAASIGLAGVGVDRTRLRVFADPAISLNTHEVDVRGYFGHLKLTMENVPSDNPKTSRIVALSVAKALRNLSEPVVIGV